MNKQLIKKTSLQFSQPFVTKSVGGSEKKERENLTPSATVPVVARFSSVDH